MTGHYGCDRITIQNLELVSIDKERNLLMVRGAVPGHNQGYLMIRQAIKSR